ncbi:MAG TPA: hypothetical protein VI757_02880 [Bacteroidia bacterium]|nr:hypothetical protein [Bacteroidia bacterium]
MILTFSVVVLSISVLMLINCVLILYHRASILLCGAIVPDYSASILIHNVTVLSINEMEHNASVTILSFMET